MTRATPPPAKRPRRQSRNTGPSPNPFSVSAGRQLQLAALKALSTHVRNYGDVFRPDRSLRSRLGMRPHTEPRLKGAVVGLVIDTLPYL